MARFARDRRLVEAIVEGVAAIHQAHAVDGAFEGRDVVDWLDAHRRGELQDLYNLYRDCVDPAKTAGQQLETYLHTLGQINAKERVSESRIDPRGGGSRVGAREGSTWDVSEEARDGLSAARETLFGPGGFFERIAKEPAPAAAPGWLGQTAGAFRDDPVFAEMVRLGREVRDADRPPADEP